jgi:hypothetical protein
MIYLSLLVAVLAWDGSASGLPANVSIPNGYRRVVAEMYRYSPTFRRQCVRLSRAAYLQIDISSLARAGPGGDGAFTQIIRRGGGAIDARVQIAPSCDPVTCIAHEFEHILEQLDEVDLAVMATRKSSGVHLVRDSSHFETDRAIAMGLAVAREVERGRRQCAACARQ